MPPEPDSPIERQLRDYAERRRSAASEDQFKIHPVTRNSLKVEIVRQYGRRLPGQEAEKSGWSWFWPKLAFAGTGLVILVVALIVFQPATVLERNRDVALNESPESAEPPTMPESKAQSDGFVPVDALVPQSAAERSSRVVHQFSRSSTAVAVPATRRRLSAQPSSAETEQVPGDNVERAKLPARAEAATAAPGAEKGGRNLLQSFQFIMNGGQVTVVDQDNSRSEGTIQPTNPDTITAGGTFGPPSLGDASDPDFPRKYRLYSESGGRTGRMAAGEFTVRGVNVTLGKEIRFTGRMLTWTQVVSAAGPSSILQIQGTAMWDGEPPLQVEATTSAE